MEGASDIDRLFKAAGIHDAHYMKTNATHIDMVRHTPHHLLFFLAMPKQVVVRRLMSEEKANPHPHKGLSAFPLLEPK